MEIARVEPLTRARALRGPFDYRVPESLDVRPGSVLVIPFGRRRCLGVVVGLSDSSDVPVDRLLAPYSMLETDVPEQLVKLGLLVAEEYCSTPARGLALVLPPGTGTGATARTSSRSRLTASITATGTAALEDGTRLGARQQVLLGALADGGRPAGALLRERGGTHTTLRALERRGLVTLEQQRVRRRPPIRPVGARSDAPHVLSADQAVALAAVLVLLDQPGEADRRLLLHGVTGSGKTEVYLAAVAAVLERGRSAIVLVPEIALTPQTASRFQQWFGDTVAILHSQLSDGERYDEWLRLRSGEARVCVGPRSAVFAPLEQLGLIVIDEEHDGSYKQEGDPRYDARRVAELRAGAAGAVLLAGSATPRPESWASFPRLSMPDRVDSLPLPAVEVVGMAGIEGALHPRTVDALAEVRERGSKAIVMLNRRGWSNFLACRDCGHTWGCPNCDVTLVLHQAAGRISCHHCGHSQAAPRACSECGSVSVGRHGIGTERLEHELDRLLGPLEVLRLDSDTGSGREATARLLERFEALEAGVLIGTQMVAKGHDFPDVALGVVLDADATLRFPDFRAEERTFSLVAQLAGRSGRGPGGGRVLVQALEPDAECLRLAATHDAPTFLAAELERRAALRYPPFGNLIRVVCSCPEHGPELEVATLLAGRVAALAPEATTVAGPAPLFRLKGRERAQLLVKSESRSAAVAAVREAVETTAAEPISRPVAFAVDVDPQ